LDIDQGFVEAEVGLALTLGAQGSEAEGLEIVAPGDSRRSAVVEGVLLRRSGILDEARELLAPSEFRAGEDAQRWALTTVRSEPRQGIILGDDALDLGYIAGFGGSESAGGRAMRWLLGQGTVRLPLPEPLRAGSTLMLDLAAPLPRSGPLDLVVNGGWRVQLAVAPEWRRYHIMLPDSLAGQQQLRLDLRGPTTIPALTGSGGDDARPLSVMVHSVRVAP
jgi:hypothetical protein